MKATSGFNLRSFLLAIAFLSGLGCISPASAERAYLIDLNSKTATDLGTLGGDSSSAWGINDAGQVVGESFTAAGPGPSGILSPHAFITGPGGLGMRDLGTLGGDSSRAFGIMMREGWWGRPTPRTASPMPSSRVRTALA